MQEKRQEQLGEAEHDYQVVLALVADIEKSKCVSKYYIAALRIALFRAEEQAESEHQRKLHFVFNGKPQCPHCGFHFQSLAYLKRHEQLRKCKAWRLAK